jgi:NAD(P)-dependent dehydrogenase (short-subunit alcohol dehydrogenase family)
MFKRESSGEFNGAVCTLNLRANVLIIDVRMIFDLTEEVAVVIGATGVLGGKMAEGLAQAGAKVAVLGRHAGRGEACVERIRQAKGEARFFAADAVSRDSLRQAGEQIQAAFGPPTVLVNAAGGADSKTIVTEQLKFEQIALEDWRANFDLNLVGGVLLPCQEFGPGMVARGRGSIINIASVAAHVALSRVAAYAAAKAAVLNLTQFLAREWGPRNVRVNTITPGFFPAEQNRRLLFQEDGAPTLRAKSILTHTPMGRFGRAEELIGAAVFLASERASSFVTGSDVRGPSYEDQNIFCRRKTGLHPGRVEPEGLVARSDSAVPEMAGGGDQGGGAGTHSHDSRHSQ